jgi:hypothetical protein
MEQTNVVPPAAPVKISSAVELPAFGVLLKQSLKMYEVLFKKVVTLALISALALLPLVLVVFSFGFLSGQPLAIKVLSGVLFAAALIFLIYVASAAQAATLFIIEDNNRGVGEYLKKGLGMAWKVVVVSLLTGLLTLLWTLLLIIPGIIFSVYYCFSIYALVFENQTGMAALRRSHTLVKNYWWAVFGRTFLLGVVYFAAMVVVSLPISFLPENSALAIFWNIVLSALRFIIGPIFVIFSYLIFKELVIIKGSALTNAAQKTA